MQIMSKTNRTASLLLVFAAITSTGAEGADNALQAMGSTFLSNGKVIKSSHYRGGLQALARFSELFVISGTLSGDGSLVLVRQPTRRLSMHRCGAGHEDFLALVRFHSGDVTLLDKIPLQSCKNSIDLDLPEATEPDAIVSAIKFDGDLVSFSVVAPTRESDIGVPETRRYRLVKDRFVKQ